MHTLWKKRQSVPGCLVQKESGIRLVPLNCLTEMFWHERLDFLPDMKNSSSCNFWDLIRLKMGTFSGLARSLVLYARAFWQKVLARPPFSHSDSLDRGHHTILFTRGVHRLCIVFACSCHRLIYVWSVYKGLRIVYARPMHNSVTQKSHRNTHVGTQWMHLKSRA